MTTPQVTLETRIRAILRAMPMETVDIVYGVQVERLLSGRGYWFIVAGLRMNLEQATWEVARRVQAESDTV